VLGWEIFIYQYSPDESPEAFSGEDALLARWMNTSFGALDWLEELVSAGKAEKVREDGYPTLYTSVAKHVAPIVSSGEATREAWPPSKFRQIDHEKLKRCPPDQPVKIEAWDQS
jgi:hypothetical protein